MKIIFLTFYFEPDLCAGSFRNTPLAKEIAKQIDSKSEVHVITTHPNRYYSFKTEALSYENSGSLHIHRIKIPTHKSGLIDQAKSFTKFFFAALKITRNIEYDLVYASSSRLFTAFLGRVISIQKKAPLYLDIRDIFVDTINNIFQHKIIRVFLLTFLRVVENFTFSNAKHLNLISEGFIPYFKKYTRPYYSYFPNGIDPIFTSIKIHNPQKSNFKIITYAGNIGEGQGLHKIIPDLAKKLKNNYRFIIIGDGGGIDKLRSVLKENRLESIVELRPPVPRNILVEVYQNSHFLFLHLNNLKAFEKVLPSKLFEYSAFDKPILAGVKGFAQDFIENNVSNSIVFSPTKANELVDKLNKYEYKNVDRSEFVEKFKRENINIDMVKTIVSYAK